MFKGHPPKSTAGFSSYPCCAGGSPESLQKRAPRSHRVNRWTGRAQPRALRNGPPQIVYDPAAPPLACIALAGGKTAGGAEKRSSAGPSCPAPACLPPIPRKECTLPPSPYRAEEHKTDGDRTGEEKKEQKKY